jgi:hypothetical protein
MESTQTMHQFVMEEETVKIQTLAFAMLVTQEMIAKHHFVLVLKILWLVPIIMEFVLITILVVVIQDMEERSVSFQSVLVFFPMNQMFVIPMEFALHQIPATVPVHTVETNVNFLIVMEFHPFNRLWFAVEMGLVFLQTIVIATMDTLEVIAMFTFAVENYPMIQLFVTHMENVLEKINAIVTMDIQEAIVNSAFAIQNHPMTPMSVILMELVFHQTFVSAKVDTLVLIAIYSLVLIEILVMYLKDAVIVLVQTIAHVLLNTLDQIVPIQFVMGKAQLIQQFVQEMDFVKVQTIANAQQEVTQVRIATLPFVLM